MTDIKPATDEEIANWDHPSSLRAIQSLIARIRAETAKNSGEVIEAAYREGYEDGEVGKFNTEDAWHVSETRAALSSLCQTCDGRGEVGGYQRFGDGEVDCVIEPCPVCATPANSSAEAIGADDLDWVKVAKLSNEYGIRYATNKKLVDFVNAILSPLNGVESRAEVIGECIEIARVDRGESAKAEYTWFKVANNIANRLRDLLPSEER